jgi:hypothetical protein
MSPQDFCPEQRAPSGAFSNKVSLSPWVNERFPPWGQLLSAHDVARLTRRPPWLLASLTLLGCFPRKCRYRGRGIGWLRSDVLRWLVWTPPSDCHDESASETNQGIDTLPAVSLRQASRCRARRWRGRCLGPEHNASVPSERPGHRQCRSLSYRP